MGVVVCRMCCPTHAVSEVSAVWPCVFCVLIVGWVAGFRLFTIYGTSNVQCVWRVPHGVCPLTHQTCFLGCGGCGRRSKVRHCGRRSNVRQCQLMRHLLEFAVSRAERKAARTWRGCCCVNDVYPRPYRK